VCVLWGLDRKHGVDRDESYQDIIKNIDSVVNTIDIVIEHSEDCGVITKHTTNITNTNEEGVTKH